MRKTYDFTNVKNEFPIGSIVELTEDMPGEEGMEKGLRGKVVGYYPSTEHIGVSWENGRSLCLMQGDSFVQTHLYGY